MQRAPLSMFRLLPVLSALTLKLWLTCAQAMGHGIADTMNRAGLLQVSPPFSILWRFYSFYCLFEECVLGSSVVCSLEICSLEL